MSRSAGLPVTPCTVCFLPPAELRRLRSIVATVKLHRRHQPHRFTSGLVFDGNPDWRRRSDHGGRLGNTSSCPARHEPTRRMARWQRGQSGTAPQGAQAVAPDLGGGMQPAEGAHAGEVARQGVLQEAAHELQRFQRDRSVPARCARAVTPAPPAIGHQRSPMKSSSRF